MIYIISTPIGNLKDITLRALEKLQEVDGIICEDTRHTAILLNHYQIKKPLLVLNDFNEARTFNQIIEKLKNGQNLALISDAGTPLISDPGYKLIRECLHQNIEVDSLPGPTAAIAALTLSSLPPDKFLFLGYPPEKPGSRNKWLLEAKNALSAVNSTAIIYISPYKLKTLLKELQIQFGDINITLARELTKIHQTVQSKKISDFLSFLEKNNPKGEYVLLFNLKQS